MQPMHIQSLKKVTAPQAVVLVARIFLVSMTLQLSTGCFSSSDVDIKKARALAAEKKSSEAAALFAKVAKVTYESARAKNGKANSDLDVVTSEAAAEAAKIYQFDLKNFSEAIANYRIVIDRSPKAENRRDAQVKIAAILFYDLQDFPAAVVEYSKLLSLSHTPEEEGEWRSRIAKAYYYQGDYYQSQVEVEKILKNPLNEEAQYQAQLLKANIHIGAKEHDEAAKVLELMIAKFPDRSKSDSLPLMLAVAFEEQKNFAKAIEVLERVRSYDSRKSFIDEKIKSLRERQGQQPGARGFRK